MFQKYRSFPTQPDSKTTELLILSANQGPSKNEREFILVETLNGDPVDDR